MNINSRLNNLKNRQLQFSRFPRDRERERERRSAESFVDFIFLLLSLFYANLWFMVGIKYKYFVGGWTIHPACYLFILQTNYVTLHEQGIFPCELIQVWYNFIINGGGEVERWRGGEVEREMKNRWSFRWFPCGRFRLHFIIELDKTLPDQLISCGIFPLCLAVYGNVVTAPQLTT